MKTRGQIPRWGAPSLAGALLALLWLGLPVATQAQQPTPPPGFTLPPTPTVPAQPPGPPGLGGAPRLPAVPIAPPPSTVPPPVAAVTPRPIPTKPLTPGKLDPTMLSWPGGVDPGRRKGRLPEVAIDQVGAAVPDGPDTIKPGNHGGHSESVGLLLSDDGKSVLPAAVSLRFAGEHKGKLAWVHPVDGGAINGQPGGRFVEVGPGGLIAFTFQPPAEAGLHHIVLRLDDIQSDLPFWVLKAKELDDTRSPAEHVLKHPDKPNGK